MQIDIVTIFPEFFGVLDVSLLGKARRDQLLALGVHDLRDWTSDRHRTVDDTPYGGGAGMVMKPEPWGAALDALLGEPAAGDSGDDGEQADAVVIFPTPAGVPFTQALARELANERRLVFACGRYEGIDARVADYAATRARVLEVSLGDYVLNGGEVAAMAMIEAIGRLVPGVVGNPESLVEESHEAGLLEHPSYTKPQVWRGLEVPAVLRSGNHAHVAAWRHEQSLERTRRVRPDLLPDDQR
ncbi:tRNA (guanosine(37)-N1)-methyltransferase TrmD [Agrococcus sp. Marseille-P2731]|uniref:tRNA (guanosine(37)-N1)-methyltransferase TrmD n=1 Tax=Agrococcus sp. Marseille-P2731 TaxID=1841862 RepID=UPI0009319398|nr:tRNA (guanosine(37)-N1)-methyltransferase TrmD [Agrococcus sp. Marseille-P2731]